MITLRTGVVSFWVLTVFLLLNGGYAKGGTWTALVNQPPAGVDTMLLLSDGTVMAADGNTGWYKLTPNSAGSYVNGTWSTMPSMNFPRLYYSSAVLTNGQVLVAGGEYGTGTTNSEIYDPVANTWTYVPVAPGVITMNNNPAGVGAQNTAGFMDSGCVMLPNGNLLVAPVIPATNGNTAIFVTASNLWITGPKLVRGSDQDEASWVKLPDDSIVSIDPFGTHSERYIPSQNKWVNDGTVPVSLYDAYGGELGAGFLLPNGQVFVLGATGNTALYTPAGGVNPGTWTAGPVIPNGQGTVDAPAAMMVNGKILCAVAQAPFDANDIFNYPASFYEYDPVANAFNQVNGPIGTTFNEPTYPMRMVDLPDGTVLLSTSSSQLYVYQPSGTPLAAGQPTISTISQNVDGSYTLTGTLLNGISEGAAYGDDAQMDSNYPLVRMTNSVTGKVYYARTYGWGSTSVMTSNRVMTTQFKVPASLPNGNYNLVVVANGNASAPVPFSTTGVPLTMTVPATLVKGSGTLTNGGTLVLGQAAPMNVVVALTAGDPSRLVLTSPVTLTPGQTFAYFNLTPVENNIRDGNQTVTVTASAPGFTNVVKSILIIDDDLPPTIVTQPASTTNSIGDTVTFSVTVTGKTPLSYTWMLNGITIPGATAGTYSTNNVQLANSGSQYSCVISNALGITNSAIATLTVQVPNLVSNGGFETGDLSGWTQAGGTQNSKASIFSTLTHSGSYGGALGFSSIPGSLSQLLPTVSGQMYAVSFWLSNLKAGSGAPGSSTYEQFQAFCNGTNFYAVTNPPIMAFRNMGTFFTAASTSTLLEFDFVNGGDYFGLDDVIVSPVFPVSFQSLPPTNGAVSFSWPAEAGLAYQVQYRTNLATGTWINLGGQITTNGPTAMVTDGMNGKGQKFYRLQVLP